MNALLPGRRPYRRDEQVRRLARRLVKLVPALDEVRYRPLLLNYCRIAILCERSYAHLKESDSLLDKSGELRASLDRYRNLTKQLFSMAREMGLSPASAAMIARPISYLDLDSMRNADEAEESEQ